MALQPSSVGGLARVLDYVGVLALLLTATVLVTGGFREWMPWGRVSVTSWMRPFAVAVIALAIRHWLLPRPSIISRLVEFARAAVNQAGVRDAAPVVIGTRSAALLIGMLAILFFGYREGAGPPWRIYENEWLNLPARWDAGWYLSIAAEGYRWEPERLTEQQNIAFFPAYPMLMRYAGIFLGRELLWTGVLISWIAFFAALVYLYRFTRDRFGEESGRAAIALIASYPFALFFGNVYTESLFLLTIVAACHHFEREELGKAGAWGLVAGLARPNGCLLSIVLACLAVRPLWPVRGGPAPADWGRLARRMAVASLPGIGMLMYSTHIYLLTGHPLQWAAQNAAWGRVYYGIESMVADQTVVLNQDVLVGFAATRTVDALQLAAVVFVLLAVWPVARRVGLPYAAMILVNVVPPLFMGGLLSMGRVTSVLFPVFVWLGASVPAHHRTAWVTGFAMLQAICAALFFTWRPLF
jgi:hypothetical protein